MRGILKRPYEDPLEIVDDFSDFHTIQAATECNCFSCMEFSSSIMMFYDDEGKLKPDWKPNILTSEGHLLAGDVLFLGQKRNGDSRALTAKEIKLVKNYLSYFSLNEADAKSVNRKIPPPIIFSNFK